MVLESTLSVPGTPRPGSAETELRCQSCSRRTRTETMASTHEQASQPAFEGRARHSGASAEAGSAVVGGMTAIAAVLMMLSGVWNFLEGLAAVLKQQFFVVLPNYAFNVSVSGWGWTHLILGLVVAAAGLCLF